MLKTGDYEWLDRPYRTRDDVRRIERTSLEDRLVVEDFSERIDIALRSRSPDDAALFYVPDGDADAPAEEVTFRDLLGNIERAAAVLRDGAGEPAVVTAVLMPAVPSIYWAILGAMRAGIVFPVNWMIDGRYLSALLREAGVTRIIALGPTPGFSIWETLTSIAGDLAPGTRIWSVAGPGGKVLPDSDLNLRMTSVTARPRPAGASRSGDAIAAYLHSGGTTGVPKIVKVSHRNLSYRHWTLQWALRSVPGEVILHDTPMFHSGGLIGRSLSAVASGATVLIPSVHGARDRQYQKNYWRFVERFKVTRLSGVPTSLAVLAKTVPKGVDLSSLKPYFATGSTALPEAVRKKFAQVSGVRVLNTYGMTENTATISIDPRDGPSKEGSSGIPMPFTDVRAAVCDDGGKLIRVCGHDEIGMLQVRGPGITPGYLDPAHERGARTDDGWFISGDLGRIDEDGYVYVTGRAKDVIIRGGHNIDPALIEEPLARHPEVLLVAAVGKPDAHAGELPIGFVQLIPGSRATPEELMTFLEGRVLERAAMPKEIHILEQLPLTEVGKPIKNSLRRLAAQREFRSVLEGAIGVAGRAGDGRLDVSVEPHAVHGTLVSIRIVGASDTERTAWEPLIRRAMSRFAYAYVVE
ncbi:MAG TPA: AMP-binding protein [Burkholderiaceae bacterium]|nr:AMP-binding protein [Burkholderiaceae bacterium]